MSRLKTILVLSPWCKEVKKTMIDKDMTLDDLVKESGYSLGYISKIINGKAVGYVAAEEKISKVLGIPYPYPA